MLLLYVYSCTPDITLMLLVLFNELINYYVVYPCIRRSLLESSLAQTHRLAAHLAAASIPLTPHPRMENETAPCCNNCLDEVFNMLFVLSHKGEYLVFCHKCAMAMEKSFTVLRQVSVSLNSAMCWFQSCAIMCTHLLREWKLLVFILSWLVLPTSPAV